MEDQAQVYTPPFHQKAIEVQQIYEHCWGDGRVSRLIIDWEAETPWFGERRTREQVRPAGARRCWFQWLIGRVAADLGGRRFPGVVCGPAVQGRRAGRDGAGAVHGQG